MIFTISRDVFRTGDIHTSLSPTLTIHIYSRSIFISNRSWLFVSRVRGRPKFPHESSLRVVSSFLITSVSRVANFYGCVWKSGSPKVFRNNGWVFEKLPDWIIDDRFWYILCNSSLGIYPIFRHTAIRIRSCTATATGCAKATGSAGRPVVSRRPVSDLHHLTIRFLNKVGRPYDVCCFMYRPHDFYRCIHHKA